MFELLTFFFSVTALSFYLLIDYYRKVWRDRRLSQTISGLLAPLQGSKVERAIEQLGEPTEIVEGPSGRRLYVWNSHRAPRLPKVDGLLIVSVTVNEAGEITQSSWKG